METTSTTFQNVTAEQINALFQGLQNQLKDIKQNFEPKTPTELLSRDELAEILKCDRSTIHNWTIKGKLKKYGIGNRTYYKRSEVEAAITPL